MGETVDGRSDIYSFGILLYEMLAGRPPFRGDNVAEILTSHIDRKPPSILELNPRADCPPAFEGLVQSCLAKAPAHRPEDMGEVTRKLANLARGPESIVPQFEEAISTDIELPELPSGDLPDTLLPPPSISNATGVAQSQPRGYDRPPSVHDSGPVLVTPVNREALSREPSVLLRASRRPLYLAGLVMLIGALGLLVWASQI